MPADCSKGEVQRRRRRRCTRCTRSSRCRTYVFRPCRYLLAFSVLAYTTHAFRFLRFRYLHFIMPFSTLVNSYLGFPYLCIPPPGTYVFRTCIFSLSYMGALRIFGSPCMATPTANFPDIFNGLLFRSIP